MERDPVFRSFAPTPRLLELHASLCQNPQARLSKLQGRRTLRAHFRASLWGSWSRSSHPIIEYDFGPSFAEWSQFRTSFEMSLKPWCA
jgi:hypothetical protein